MATQKNRLAYLSKDEREIYRSRALALFNAIAATEHPTLYAIVRHVSSSGLSRRIQFLTAENGAIRDVSYEVAIITGSKLYDDGVFVTWAWMDMAYYLATNVSCAIDPNRYDIFRVVHL